MGVPKRKIVIFFLIFVTVFRFWTENRKPETQFLFGATIVIRFGILVFTCANPRQNRPAPSLDKNSRSCWAGGGFISQKRIGLHVDYRLPASRRPKKIAVFNYVARSKWEALNRATARAPRATTTATATATATAVAIDLRLLDFSQQAKMETRDFGQSKNGGRIRRTHGVFCGVWRATKAPPDGPGCVQVASSWLSFFFLEAGRKLSRAGDSAGAARVGGRSSSLPTPSSSIVS